MTVKRGEIVLVEWIYSDRTGSKVRPALVVQNDQDNQRLDDTILALITGSHRRVVGSPTQLFIDVGSPDGQQSGLRQNSLVQCENLSTIDQSLILRTLGSLSDARMNQIDDCLKAALELS
jgi:mRNA interferase MazF